LSITFYNTSVENIYYSLKIKKNKLSKYLL